jgi:hypothetical protein
MSEYHDPLRQATSLSDVYAQDRRPLGFFLAAGCPHALKANDGEALLPAIRGLTEQVAASMPDANTSASMELAQTCLKTDGNDTPDIESILTFIRSLKEVVGPTGEVRGFSKTVLESLDSAICCRIADIVDVDLPAGNTAFDQLSTWIGSIPRGYPTEIFTTNYDLLIEQALERHRVPYFDGFVGACDAFFDQRAIDDDLLPQRWARLWKLHGSINWELDSSGNVTRRTSLTDSVKSRLIHPSHLKYTESRRMPYLAMIDRMRFFLRQPSAVIIISGYSFRDEHLNEIFLQGVQGNVTAVIFALQHGNITDYPAATALAEASQNFNILCKREAIIGGDRAPWRMRQAGAQPEARFSTFWKSDSDSVEDFVAGEFLLGDFSSLGAFLESFVSRRTV